MTALSLGFQVVLPLYTDTTWTTQNVAEPTVNGAQTAPLHPNLSRLWGVKDLL